MTVTTTSAQGRVPQTSVDAGGGPGGVRQGGGGADSGAIGDDGTALAYTGAGPRLAEDPRREKSAGRGLTGVRRDGSARAYLMCRPEHFAVSYAINPWMDPARPVDADRALAQWETLHRTYLRLGHRVEDIDPVAGLPDMVFAANGATVIGGRVLGARFRYAERAAEGVAYLDWFRQRGYQVVRVPQAVNEGEGDILEAGSVVIAGYGFRTEPAAHAEVAALFGKPVLSVRLVDPRFYHLDTALCVLNAHTAAYYPAAFDDAGRATLASHFTELIEAKDEDAEVLGLNAVSDGHHVIIPAQARALAGQLAARGFEPVPVDMSEFSKAGGGPKCCTLELRG